MLLDKQNLQNVHYNDDKPLLYLRGFWQNKDAHDPRAFIFIRKAFVTTAAKNKHCWNSNDNSAMIWSETDTQSQMLRAHILTQSVFHRTQTELFHGASIHKFNVTLWVVNVRLCNKQDRLCDHKVWPSTYLILTYDYWTDHRVSVQNTKVRLILKSQTSCFKDLTYFTNNIDLGQV